jgi:two-component system, OmpR family, sensor kinase
MSDTASSLRRHWLEAIWVAFAAVNVLALLRLPDFGTIPFLFIWITFTLFCGLCVWRMRTTLAVLSGLCATVGVALAWVVIHDSQRLEDVTEVPLMAGMFLAMAWHARRRQTAVEEVQRAAERERAFLRDASHQLKTPLAIARGYADVIRGGALPRQVSADVDTLVGELERLGHIAEGLLLLASSEEERALPGERIDFEDLVVTVSRRWSKAASRLWRVEARADGVLLGDRSKLESALDAIVENAVTATTSRQVISIVGRAENGTAVVEICDDGRGVEPVFMPHAFDRFASRWPDSVGAGGSGLGLSIARAIVEAHGGTIVLESRAGKGTAVTVRLPHFVAAPAVGDNGSRQVAGNAVSG